MHRRHRCCSPCGALWGAKTRLRGDGSMGAQKAVHRLLSQLLGRPYHGLASSTQQTAVVVLSNTGDPPAREAPARPEESNAQLLSPFPQPDRATTMTAHPRLTVHPPQSAVSLIKANVLVWTPDSSSGSACKPRDHQLLREVWGSTCPPATVRRAP
jgi:hypothetical protein